ncbi:hypothetical protein PIB30_015319 [Stylosanthes scabra]|uniref:KIB1-4 beta-propeller domain-containing protein n=1 Tax=Stylosanthes scabra TaxID=79078 RepID=A0ABU6Q7N5_9FABA|nr:hypothetical protein [Stylosanthes scabra]
MPHRTCHDDISRVHSVQGWLMFNQFHHVRKEDKTFSELSFFNPFSRARIKLPKFLLFSGRSPGYCHVLVVFNSAPPVDDGDKLYALAFKHNTSVVFVLNLKDHHHERLVILNAIEDINFAAFSFGFESHGRRHRLAMNTSTGELLIVSHDVYTGCKCCIYSIRTEEFRVYKLERSSLRWCEIFDIGDRFFLWDYTASVSVVSAKGLIRVPEEFRRGNCIIFCNEDGSHNKGVFFLADRTIIRFPIIKRSVSWQSLQNMWFTPAP